MWGGDWLKPPMQGYRLQDGIYVPIEPVDGRLPSAEFEDKWDKLQETIDVICEDAARVELWACALSGFSRPIPDYDQPYDRRPNSKPP